MLNFIKYSILFTVFSTTNHFLLSSAFAQTNTTDATYNFIMSFAPNTILAGECLEVTTYSSNFPATKTINIQFPPQGDLHFYSDKGCTQEVTNTGIQLNASDHFYVRSKSLVKQTDNPNYIYYPYITVIAFDGKTSYYSTSSLQINPDPAYSTTITVTDPLRDQFINDGKETAGACIAASFKYSGPTLSSYIPYSISLTSSDSKAISFYSSPTCDTGTEIDSKNPLTSISKPFYIRTTIGKYTTYTINASIDGIKLTPQTTITTTTTPNTDVELIPSTQSSFDGECVSVQAKFTDNNIKLNQPNSILVTSSNSEFFKDPGCSTSVDGTITINPGNTSTTIYTLINQGVGKSTTLTAQSANPFFSLNTNSLTIKDDHPFSVQLTGTGIKYLNENTKTFCISDTNCINTQNITTTIANNQCAEITLTSIYQDPAQITVNNSAHIYNKFSDCRDDQSPKDAANNTTKFSSEILKVGDSFWVGDLNPEHFTITVAPSNSTSKGVINNFLSIHVLDFAGFFSAAINATSSNINVDGKQVSVWGDPNASNCSGQASGFCFGDFSSTGSFPSVNSYGNAAKQYYANPNPAGNWFPGSVTYPGSVFFGGFNTDPKGVGCPYDASNQWTSQPVLGIPGTDGTLYVCVREAKQFERSLFTFKGISNPYIVASLMQNGDASQNYSLVNSFLNSFYTLPNRAQTFGSQADLNSNYVPSFAYSSPIIKPISGYWLYYPPSIGGGAQWIPCTAVGQPTYLCVVGSTDQPPGSTYVLNNEEHEILSTHANQDEFLTYAYGGVDPVKSSGVPFSSDGQFSQRNTDIYTDGQFYYFGGISGSQNSGTPIYPNLATGAESCDPDMDSRLVFGWGSISSDFPHISDNSVFLCTLGGWNGAPNGWRNAGSSFATNN